MERAMISVLSFLLVLACPLGMAAMMGIPALLRRFRRTGKPASATSPVDSDVHAPAHQGG
jgi:hypothetical protein